MSDLQERFQVPCPKCGGTDFEIPENMEDSSFVKCVKCGFEAVLEDLREHGTELAKNYAIDEIKKQMKKMFK